MSSSTEWKRANPERNRAQSNKSYYKNKANRLANSKQWAARNPDKIRSMNRRAERRKQGNPIVTDEKRNGACPICFNLRDLVPDHNHTTGILRDWICIGCNLRLGKVENGKFSWPAFVEYLEKWGRLDGITTQPSERCN